VRVSFLSGVLGRRLANREQSSRRIGWFEAVPAMGLDSLASSSYGPEAALAVLIPLGAAGVRWIGPLMAPIVALLSLLYLSYRQTIIAYPSNGGAYFVAKENLGRLAGLVAAAALMIDYTLNVSVGISAGVGALTSTVPSLHPHTVALCAAILAVIALANLRGTGEAGWLFALPTYAFIVSFLGLIGIGLYRAVVGGGHPAPVIPPPPLGPPVEAVGAWILLRAFAAGCTAMTGVEAISNGVGAFKEPVVAQAHRTLTIICGVLALLLAGVAALAQLYGVGAMDQTRPGYQSVLSQLAGAVAGHGTAYYIAMASALAVLCLSANTSYVGFPRLCKLVAHDGYLPHPFAVADRRLVFSVSIGFMTLAAGGLLILFRGVTDRLIPLFAIGAFLSFTLSQCGMVARWRREGGRHRARMALNAIGAAATLIALLVILTAKFVDGAWIVALVAPATIGLLHAIHRYYVRLESRIAVSGPFQLGETEPPTVLVAVEKRSRMIDRALQFAMTISPDVIAVHLMNLEGPDEQEDVREIKRRWEEEVVAPVRAQGGVPPRLLVLPAPYRNIADPLLELLRKIDADTPGRSVAVLIPELVLTHWWERLLHPRRAERLREALLAKGGPRLNVIITPWRS
jgi:amino acid transporter